MPDSVWPVFSLSIAGISVAVECNDIALDDELRRHYHAFLSQDPVWPKAHLQIDSHSHASASANQSIAFRDGVVHVIAADHAGFIDEAQGVGRLSLSSTQPLEDVDHFLRVAYALLAFRAGGLLFHAAGIVRNECAYLFFGQSGSGKTTIARHSPKDRVLNDDLVLLLPQAHDWLVYATPFWRPTQAQPAGAYSAPPAAMFRLVQDRTVCVESIGMGEALAEVISSIPIVSLDPARNSQLVEQALHLLQVVPAYRLHFRPDDSFWPVVESCQKAASKSRVRS